MSRRAKSKEQSEVSKLMLMDKRKADNRQQEVIYYKEERWHYSQPPVLSKSVELTQEPDLKQRDLVSKVRGLLVESRFTFFSHAMNSEPTVLKAAVKLVSIGIGVKRKG